MATSQYDVLGIQDGSVTSAMIADGTIINSDVSATGGIYSSKDAVYENTATGFITAGQCITLTASCNDSNVLPISGQCEPAAAIDADLRSTRTMNWDDSQSISQYQCTVCNEGTIQQDVINAITCIDVP